MSAQPSLFDGAVGLYRGKPGHARGSDTSREAAKRVTRLNERQRAVLDAIRARPSTVWEVMDALGVPYDRKDSIAPRITELTNMARPMVVDSGERRMSPRNRPCTVWKAA